MLDNPFGEEIFPNIQSKPPLAQPEAVSSHPIAFYLGEETDTHLATTSFQVVVESDKVMVVAGLQSLQRNTLPDGKMSFDCAEPSETLFCFHLLPFGTCL